jgi:crotonobetainyl-CoA:carnitine CoA-transferase CaiB-like acyl-CoA transferase
MLDGYSIVALATYIPGPVAAARLRDLGASVVKIEPLHGDPLEAAAPHWYAQLTARVDVRKRDMRDTDARAELHALLAGADLVLTAMRARSLAKLGIDETSLRSQYPKLSHLALVGEAPPNDDRAGHDLTYQARAGTIVPPAIPRALIGDMAAAERLVSSAIGALLHRERTGKATFATVGITECALEFAAAYRHGLTAPGGDLGGGLPGYQLYRASDGWIALAALESHFAQRLCALLSLENLDEASLRSAFSSRSAQAWETLAEQHDVPLAAVR